MLMPATSVIDIYSIPVISSFGICVFVYIYCIQAIIIFKDNITRAFCRCYSSNFNSAEIHYQVYISHFPPILNICNNIVHTTALLTSQFRLVRMY